jgi:hypothetical protein
VSMNLYHIRAMDIDAGEDLDLIVKAESFEQAVELWFAYYEAHDTYEGFEVMTKPTEDDTIDEIHVTMLEPPAEAGVVPWHYEGDANLRWVALDWKTEEDE